MKKLSFLLLVFPLCVWTADSDSGFNVLSFNIDTNIGRTEEGYVRDSMPEWRVNERMPAIIAAIQNVIDNKSPDVIQLQEGRKFDTKYGDHVDSITPLTEFLKSNGYYVQASQYNPSDRAFSYIGAVKSDRFDVDESYPKYFTKTPDVPTDHSNHGKRKEEIKDHNFGEEWERSARIISFHDKAGQKYYAFNVHLGMGKGHRVKACTQLKELAKDIIAQEPNAKIIMTGDFNTFPDWGGAEQLEALTGGDSPLTDATADLRLPNGKKVDTSFITFPYDYGADSRRLDSEISKLYDTEPVPRRKRALELFEKEAKALGGHLDRAPFFGFNSAKATLIPTPQYEGFNVDQFGEDYIKQYILDHADEGPAFASDHQPVLIEFE